MRAVPRSIVVVICFFLTSFPERSFGQSNEIEIKALLSRVSKGIDSRNFTEALAAANEAVAKAKALPKPNPQLFADTLSFQAVAQHNTGQSAVAATTYRTAIIALSRVYGSQSLNVAGALNNLGRFESDAGNFEAARKTLMSSLVIKRNRPDVGPQLLINTLLNLSDTAMAVRDYASAESYLNEIVSIFSKIDVKEVAYYPDAMIGLAHIKYAKGEDAAGQAFVDKALDAVRSQFGEGQLFVAQLNNQAEIFRLLGRYSDAEQGYRKALSLISKLQISDPAKAVDPRTTDQIKNNLAINFRAMNRLPEAEQLLREVVLFRQKQFGPNDQRTADAYVNLANVYLSMDPGAHYGEAIGLLKSAEKILSNQFGKKTPLLFRTLQSQAALYGSARSYDKASEYLKLALAASVQISGEDSAQSNGVRMSLGNAQRLAGDVKDALPTLERAYKIEKQSALPIDEKVASAGLNLGLAYYDLGRFDDALSVLRAVRDSVVAEAASNQLSLSTDPVREARGFFRVGQAILDTIHHVSQTTGDVGLSNEAFTTWQIFSQTEASLALQRLGARTAGAIAKVEGNFDQIKKLTDLLQRRRLINDQLRSTFATGSPRDGSELTSTLDRLTTEIESLTKELERTEPELGNLYLPKPLSIDQVQRLLHADEALVQYATFPGATYVWVITPTDSQFKQLELNTPTEIDDLTAGLRCGLDRDAWKSSTKDCKKLLGATVPSKTQPLPFDLVRANRLYNILLLPFERSIENKQLIFVPSGSLATLPFATLITKPPAGVPANYRSADWLGLVHPMSVLPSVSALKVFRQSVKQSGATKVYTAFGNPLLDGLDSDRVQAKAAADNQLCAPPTQIVQIGAYPKGLTSPLVDTLTNGNLGDPNKIRKLTPLPQTAKELCEVGADLGAPLTDIYLGAAATESRIKAMSASKALREFRIIHFSTHGLLATETAGYSSNLAEPALILTPPQQASENDDGLLTASEIALLDLDSDWIILSACNTAAGDNESGNPYEGLARAFFYAGARSILASHWFVDADASRILISRIFANAEKDITQSRSERLRSAMRFMIRDYADPIAANPEYWAPFVIVGEGAN